MNVQEAREKYERVIKRWDNSSMTDIESAQLGAETYDAWMQLESLLGNIEKCYICKAEMPWRGTSRYHNGNYIHMECWAEYEILEPELG